MFILLKGLKSGLATGVKVELCLSVSGELVGPSEAIFPPLSMLKNALLYKPQKEGKLFNVV